MSTLDVLIVLFFAPPVSVIAMWLGRLAQRRVWRLDLPYEQRLALFNDPNALKGGSLLMAINAGAFAVAAILALTFWWLY